MRTRVERVTARRLVRIGIAIVGVAMALGVARTVVRMAGPRLMETMAEKVMPRMMDACFGQMPQQRREFMLTHCRGMLDRVDEKYAVTQSAEPSPRPVAVA